jgi:hypothetical protein
MSVHRSDRSIETKSCGANSQEMCLVGGIKNAENLQIKGLMLGM